MRQVVEKAKQYKELKDKNLPTLQERYFMRSFERAFSVMNGFDRNFFAKVYIKEEKKDWWKKYYEKSTYHKIRMSVSRKFLKEFIKYEK